MSVGDFTQIAIGPQPVQICPPLGQGITVTIYNADINNVITVSRNNSVSLNASNGAPIQPLTSAVLDATKPLYAVAPAGTAPLVVLPQGGTLSPSPAQIAAQVALAGQAKPVYNIGTTIVGISGSITPAPINGGVIVNGNNAAPIAQYGSYEIQLVLTCNVADSGFVTLTMQWYNSITDTNPVDQTQWIMPAGSSGGQAVYGHGPQRGSYLVIMIQNNSTNAHSITVNSFVLSGSNRVYTSDDIRSAGVSNLNTLSNGVAQQNELAVITGISVPISTTFTWGVSLYSGEAFVHVDAGSTGTISLFIFDYQGLNITKLHPGQGNSIDELIILPRNPCTIALNNLSSTAAGTGSFALVANRL